VSIEKQQWSEIENIIENLDYSDFFELTDEEWAHGDIVAVLEKRLLDSLKGEADALEFTPEQVRDGNFFTLLQEHAKKTR